MAIPAALIIPVRLPAITEIRIAFRFLKISLRCEYNTAPSATTAGLSKKLINFPPSIYSVYLILVSFKKMISAQIESKTGLKKGLLKGYITVYCLTTFIVFILSSENTLTR